jgi:Holliday junction DNA helicase RuvB
MIYSTKKSKRKESFMSNVVDKKMIDGDEIESSLRPLRLDEYVGQIEIKEMLKIYITTAKMREEPLDHVL